MSIVTGNGATFVLAGFVMNLISIKMPSFSIPDINESHLLTSGFEEYRPGDLEEPDMLTIKFQLDTEDALPVRGAVGTGTLTLPVPDGMDDGATLIGTGYINKLDLPELKNNTLAEGTLQFKFDGKTGPTWTPAATDP